MCTPALKVEPVEYGHGFRLHRITRRRNDMLISLILFYSHISVFNFLPKNLSNNLITIKKKKNTLSVGTSRKYSCLEKQSRFGLIFKVNRSH